MSLIVIGWIAPDLPGALTQGETMEEAWEMFGDAASMFFDGDEAD